MSTQNDFTIGQIDTDLIPNYKGIKYYHPCLVYKPKELVLIQPTIYAKELRGKGTAKTYLKVLQRFCQWFQGQIQDRENLVEHLSQFERLATLADIERWMADRDLNRAGNSPTDSHIEQDAKKVARFLSWAKNRLEKRGVIVAFEGGYKLKKLVHLRMTNLYLGVQGPIEVERTEFGLVLGRKSEPGESPEKHARNRQNTMGHEYLSAHELKIFFNSFSDQLYRYICMTGYHTGLRPHEVLGIPRFKMYNKMHDGLNFFTSDPGMLSSLMAKGHKHIYLMVEGKGSKLRRVKFVIKHWHAIMEAYEKTVFCKRKSLWEKFAGQELPPDKLWLARPWGSGGRPKIVYCLPGDTVNYDSYQKPLWGAIDRARSKYNLVEKFGHGVDYYCLRHSYATNFLVTNINAEKKMREKNGLPIKDTQSIIYDINLRSQLMEQLGHEIFSTTWDGYVHNAEVLGTLELPNILEFFAEELQSV